MTSSKDRDITFRKKPKFYLIDYSNSDWAKDYINKKLILRFVFTLNKELISYSSKKQIVITLFFI